MTDTLLTLAILGVGFLIVSAFLHGSRVGERFIHWAERRLL